MIFETILTYLPFALITSFTPGPNNLISFYAVSSHGWKKGSRVLAGIGSAIFLIMIIAALFCHQISSHISASLPVLKYFGSAYILWLSIQIAKDTPGDSKFDVSTFSKGFILVFINIKMLLYALTIFSSYIVTPDTPLSILLIHVIILTMICILSNLTWASAGKFMQKFISQHYRPFNILMGLILAYCAITIIV